MNESEVFEQIRKNSDISSLPQILAEVIRVANHEDSTSKDLAGVIAKDPALTARVLKIVNSPFYSSIHPISTISQAVINLGSRAVTAVALSISLYKMFESSGAILDRIRFWRHSLETAIASREIAKYCGYHPEEEAFVAGLMHDLGLIIIENNFPDLFQQIMNQLSHCDKMIKLEHSLLGTNHARVARFLIKQWKLPSVIGEGIALHHTDLTNDAKPTKDKIHLLGSIISLANQISKFRICQIAPINQKELEQNQKLAKFLGIDSTKLAEIQEKTMGQLIKEAEFLEIKIGSLIDLLEAANHMIFKQYILVEKILRKNQEMQEQIALEQAKQAAINSLQTITITLSHYINNASATILGRAQMVQKGVEKGAITDKQNLVASSMNSIIQSVNTISQVLEELKKMSSFSTTQYLDKTSILDLEARLKSQMERIKKIPNNKF